MTIYASKLGSVVNKCNPVLVEYRDDGPHDHRSNIWWFGMVDNNAHPGWSSEQCAHAIRVLDRLCTRSSEPESP